MSIYLPCSSRILTTLQKSPATCSSRFIQHFPSFSLFPNILFNNGTVRSRMKIEKEKQILIFIAVTAEKTYTTQTNYRTHSKQIHQMKLKNISKRRVMVNPNVIPSEIDPNNYCKACEVKYKSQIIYRGHLRTFHKMILAPIKNTTIINFDKTPDLYDHNCYCCACRRHYYDRGAYRLHLRGIHKIETPPRTTIKGFQGFATVIL
jgi:hypothetical protein